MDLLIGALMIVMLALYWASRRQRETQPRFQAHPRNAAPPDGSKLIGVDGAKCIYTDRQMTVSLRISEVRIEDDLVQFRAQPLRTLGLSDVPDDVVSFCAPYNDLQRGPGCLIGRRDEWEIYFDPQLVDAVTELARKGGDEPTIKKLMRGHRTGSPAKAPA